MEVKLSMGLAMRLGLDKDGLFRNNSEKSLVDLGNAIAFAARMKDRGCSNFRHYNVNKLRDKYQELFNVRLHWETVKGYIDTLIKFGLCAIKDGQLYFKRLKSKRQERNYIVSFSDDDTIRTAGREFAKFIFSSPMRAIEYVKQLISRRNNPESLNDLKHTQAKLRRLGFDAETFKDNGVSYKTLCDRFHICAHTVSAFIKRCVEGKIFTKKRNIDGLCIHNASSRVGYIEKFLHGIYDKFTFYKYYRSIDELHIYKVRANTYIYNHHLLEASLTGRI